MMKQRGILFTGKKYLFILITPLMVFAQSYMSKFQPYDTFTIYSQASGQIVKLDKNDETKVINKTLISAKNLYIKEFSINLGDYVSTGASLSTAYDISKSKLILISLVPLLAFSNDMEILSDTKQEIIQYQMILNKQN